MRTYLKLVALTVAVVACTVLAASNASANTITAEPAGAITARSLGKLTFAGRGGIEVSVECRVTMRGSLSRTISNAAGGRLGSITAGEANECNGSNSERLLFVSPTAWELILNEASRLERSTDLITIIIRGEQLQVIVGGVTCLYAGDVVLSILINTVLGFLVSKLVLVLANSERRSSGSFLCPERGELRGTFEMTTQTLRL